MQNRSTAFFFVWVIQDPIPLTTVYTANQEFRIKWHQGQRQLYTRNPASLQLSSGLGMPQGCVSCIPKIVKCYNIRGQFLA